MKIHGTGLTRDVAAMHDTPYAKAAQMAASIAAWDRPHRSVCATAKKVIWAKPLWQRCTALRFVMRWAGHSPPQRLRRRQKSGFGETALAALHCASLRYALGGT
ncbi:hypothetical protein KI609_13710 [Acidovorax radicis]|nr:hypothetical protein [Acidovorax radicis]UCU97642.1 hypothetical protein KI609_13710 [Acidovorax radicis]